jgi:3-oxoacyl-[acyl-carrier-protein] synthase II
MVLGEGAAVVVLEELSHALARGARILGEIVGHAARCSTDRAAVGRRRQSVALAMGRALEMAGVRPADLGHVHAYGASTVTGDREEAEGIRDVLGDAARTVPTVAAKSHFGNLGGGSGLAECVASILALNHGELFPLLNHEADDEACGIRAARRGDPAGDVFISTSVTPQGQSGAVVIRSWRA